MATVAQAEDNENSYFADLPIVASASRMPQSQPDAPVAITVIDRDMIKALGARDLSDVFRLVPGFQTFAPNTTNAQVTYHGIPDRTESSRVLVLVDGRSLFSPVFDGGVNWSLIPVSLDDIERIEIGRGSNAPSYGANAFQAVINIITVDPLLSQGFSVTETIGNQGVQDISLRQGGKLGEAGSFRFRYEKKSDNGLKNGADWIDPSETRLLDFRGDLTISDADSLQISAGRVENDSYVGRSSDPTEPIHPLIQSSTHFQVSLLHTVSPDSDWQFRYAYTEDVSRNEWSGVDGPFAYTVGATPDVGQRQELELQHRFSPATGVNAVVGGSLRYDTLYSPQYLYGTTHIGRTVDRIFGNLEWKPTRWLTTNLGAAVEDDSLAGTEPSYRGSLNFHLDPENTIKLGLSHATRSGSILDYKEDGRIIPSSFMGMPITPMGLIAARLYLGNPNLESEKLNTVEIDYLGNWKSLNMSLDVRLFDEHMPNRWWNVNRDLPALCLNALPSTTLCPVPEIYQTIPIEDVRTTGLEYQWRWQPFPATRLMLSQSYAHIKADYLPGVTSSPANANIAVGTTENTNLTLLTEKSAPQLSSTLFWMQKLPFDLNFSLMGQWVGQMKWTVNTTQDSYHRIDVRLGYPFHTGFAAGEVSFVAQSLNGAHGEYAASGLPTDRIVDRRQRIALRFDL